MITHILKNGTVLQDITGHVVRREENPIIYEILNRTKTPCEVAGVEQEERNERQHN